MCLTGLWVAMRVSGEGTMLQRADRVAAGPHSEASHRNEPVDPGPLHRGHEQVGGVREQAHGTEEVLRRHAERLHHNVDPDEGAGDVARVQRMI